VNVRECFEKRLLREDRPDPRRSGRSMEVSEAKLEEAEKALRAGLPDATVILAYTAMFHAARGVLYRDGIVERSHVCLIEYLRERYVKTGRMSEALINTLDSARVDRHEALYGLETRSSEREAKHSLRRAEEFLSMVKTIL
jgi:uncharacterized protein (UPF0332 family)